MLGIYLHVLYTDLIRAIILSNRTEKIQNSFQIKDNPGIFFNVILFFLMAGGGGGKNLFFFSFTFFV